MTREDILKEVLSLEGNNWLLELPTGFGKTKLAIEKVKQLKVKKLLLVVSRIVHKQNWEDEFNKWWKDRNIDIIMTTYVSLPKHVGNYDACILDEAHHLSERCREALCSFNIKHSILLSATIGSRLKDELKEIFDDLTIYKKSLRDAIEDNILPDPKVFLLPLNLRADLPTEVLWKNPKAKGKLIETSWAMKWSYIRQKVNPVKIYCTQRQYITDLDNQIDYWKNRYFRTKNEIAKNKWLRLCGDRLKWLSDKKTPYVQQILLHLREHRTLIFCNSIEQTEMLGEYCINSKNKDSVNNLKLFNEHKIDHITACNILNEGVNLVDCQIGIYANLNSSDIIIKQRCGRLLRHKNPILVVPYFKGTREEELVNNMLENYNPKLVSVINDYKEIKI
mgnify:CR=1 FL=1